MQRSMNLFFDLIIFIIAVFNAESSREVRIAIRRLLSSKMLNTSLHIFYIFICASKMNCGRSLGTLSNDYEAELQVELSC